MATDCWELLGLERASATESAVRGAWRELAGILHPDKGGSLEEFLLHQKAYQEALAVVMQPVHCPECFGKGEVATKRKPGVFISIWQPCARCGGTGKVKGGG